MFEFLSSIAEWINSGIYTFTTDAYGYLIAQLFILWLDAKIWSLQFGWDVAKSVIESLGVNSMIQTAWGYLPSDVAAAASFFRVPDCINILLTGAITRMVISFTPFL